LNTAISSSQIGDIPASSVEDACSPYKTQIVTGRSNILAYQSLLVALSHRYGQSGAMEHLDYFLSTEDLRRKTQHLVLIGPDPAHPREGITGAVLLSEYRVFGFGTRVFVPDDTCGRRVLIGPRDERTEIAKAAADALMRKGALLVMQCWENVLPEWKLMVRDASPGRNGWVYTERARRFWDYLALESTMDATLAKIGQKTRFNLRYYRRRAEADLGCSFVADVPINREELLAFNRRCTYKVSDELAAWRHDTFFKMPGMFLYGIRERNGDWLGLLGGRRYGDSVAIDWQLNRGDLPASSLSTVMRAYLIEHEIAQGTKRMYIEGGTPQMIRRHFKIGNAQDLLVLRYGWMLRPLRKLTRRFLPKTNFVMQILGEQRIRWKPWSIGS
jgi:hypothetical protein